MILMDKHTSLFHSEFTPYVRLECRVPFGFLKNRNRNFDLGSPKLKTETEDKTVREGKKSEFQNFNSIFMETPYLWSLITNNHSRRWGSNPHTTCTSTTTESWHRTWQSCIRYSGRYMSVYPSTQYNTSTSQCDIIHITEFNTREEYRQWHHVTWEDLWREVTMFWSWVRDSVKTGCAKNLRDVFSR